jgi:hypothetical protein
LRSLDMLYARGAEREEESLAKLSPSSKHINPSMLAT